MSNSSFEYLESAEKMIGEAKEKFKKGLFSSEISYINSAKQDIENALWYAVREQETKMNS